MQKNDKINYSAKGAGITYSILICLFAMISLIGGMLIGAVGIKANTVAYYAVSVLFSLLALLLSYLFYCKKYGEDLLKVSGINRFSPIYIVVAVVVSAGMFLGFGVLNEKFAGFIASIGGVLPTGGVSDVINSTGTFILFSIIIGILPAIVEELFFRGMLLHGLRNAGRVVSVIFVAVCFALYHASVVQFIYQLIYGGVLTLLTIKSKSIVPSIIAHFLNNFLVLVLSYFFKMQSAVSNPYLIIVGIVLVVLSVLFLIFYKKEKSTLVVKGDAKSFILFATPGLIVSLIIAILGVIPV